ncbi:MAG: M23 family peptidase, partial [Opitutaceae bacterium]|nr:M23 family peptidase [Opitutaceae bacterium]
YPALADGGAPLFPPRGWEVSLDWTGLPFRWRPLGADEVRGLRPGEWRLVATNGDVLRRERSKRLAVLRRGKWVPGRDLVSVMERLFGPR